MAAMIGWAPPGTNPVLTGILMPQYMEGRLLSIDGYRMRLSARLMTLADRASVGATRTQMVRIVAPLGLSAIAAACRLHAGDAFDLLDACPDLMDTLLKDSNDEYWRWQIWHDPPVLEAVSNVALEDWVCAMFEAAMMTA